MTALPILPSSRFFTPLFSMLSFKTSLLALAAVAFSVVSADSGVVAGESLRAVDAR